MSKFQLECIESFQEEQRKQYGGFTLEPLGIGQALTVGNALRRVLLSSLEGIAITGARISGVNHEFATVAGVREDILEILLNLKQIVLTGNVDEPQIARLKVQGPALVTAEQISLPPGIDVVDPAQYITTICNNSTLEMELRIEKGKGYHFSEKEKHNLPLDFLAVDSVFMPVIKATYTTENIKTRHEEMAEKLTIYIWTNGSISPYSALTQSAEVLTNLFNPLRKTDFQSSSVSSSQEETKIAHVSIEDLQLSVRAYNCLKRAQIHTVGDLLGYSQQELLEIKNFGQKSAREVTDALQKRMGINLPKEKNNYKV